MVIGWDTDTRVQGPLAVRDVAWTATGITGIWEPPGFSAVNLNWVPSKSSMPWGRWREQEERKWEAELVRKMRKDDVLKINK